MKNELKDHLDRLVDHMLAEYGMEQTYLQMIRDTEMTADIRSEMVGYIEDRLLTHPARPANLGVNYGKIETYVDSRIRLTRWKDRLAEWQEEELAIWEQLDEIEAEFNSNLFDDADDDDTDAD